MLKIFMLKIKKIFSAMPAVILGIAVLLPNILMTALADESTSDLFNYDKVHDVAVVIEYKNDDIKFTITSPSGQKIDKNTDTDNVTVFSGSSSTIVFIGSAEAGQWKITYDKGSNKQLTVRTEIQNNSFWISDFNVSDIKDDTIPVTFTVSGEDSDSYSYSIMAVTDNNSLSGKELVSGRENTGENISVDVPLSSLSTYDEYYLMLYVSLNEGGTETFDYAYSDAFKYTNKNSPDAIEKADITVSHDSKSITADWKEHIDYRTKSVFVEYYLDGKLISSAEYPTSEGMQGFFTYDDETQTPLIKISVRNDEGLASPFAEFPINITSEKGLKLTLPDSGIVSSDIWSFDYKDGDDTEVLFTVNGENETVKLNGDGSSSITLTDKRNTVLISYRDETGVVHTYNRTANISSVTPSLSLSQPLDGITTDNDFVIIAGTTNCPDVIVNGEKAEVKDGIFTYTLPLEKGENSVKIEATIGELGTSLTATVTRTSGGILSGDGIMSYILPLIIGLTISAVGIVLTLVLSGRKSKAAAMNNTANISDTGVWNGINGSNANSAVNDKAARKAAKKAAKKAGSNEKHRGHGWLAAIIVSWTVTVGLWVWFIIRKVFENSVGFIELAYESLAKADSYITLTVILLVTAIVVTVSAITVTVIFIIIRQLKKKR